jgi:hypothetical protein
VTSNADKLEDRTAEILGQIQASVSEYVRAMNEAGALRRRETDEAHRQQDEALKLLKAVQIQAAATAEAHSKLAGRLANEWLGLVERGLREIAMEQAIVAARTSVTQIDSRLNELNAAVRDSVSKVGEIAGRNERIARSLAWKTVVITAVWLITAATCVRILFV